ncbi:MAG: ABC transporter ATP-binding protein, partial [Alphaproteobacteria bacterium]|nr:ABC transporter ATP-binding protein [Alphaproteobacteria bacterium]
MKHKNNSRNPTLSFLLNSVKPFQLYLALHLFVIICAAIETSLWPYLSKLLIDELTHAPRDQIFLTIWKPALALTVLTISIGFIWRIADYSWAKMTPLLKRRIVSEAMEYLMNHSHTFFQNNFSGALASKIRDLFNSTPKLVEIALYSFIKVALSLLIAFIALFFIHKYFAFALLIWSWLFVLMAIRAAKLTNRMSLSISSQQTKIMGNIVDALSNINNVKLFANAEFESKRIATFQNKYSSLFRRRGMFLMKFFALHSLSFHFYFIGCVALLIWLYAQSLVTLGDFLMIFTINNWIIHEMWMAANEMRTFLEEFGTVGQALNILNEPLKIKDGTKELEVPEGEITFENVRFSYHEDQPIFAEKSVTILPGQKVGLVGHSGSGKSTFVNLILR